MPKALRDALGIEPGQDLELSARDGRLEVEVPPTPMRLEDRSGQVVAVADREMPPLTRELVRETLEQTRR